MFCHLPFIWSVCLGDKMSAAQAQLSFLRREEEAVMHKLREAELQMNQTPYVFSENETVFDDDFENGTIVDEATGETFGFGP